MTTYSYRVTLTYRGGPYQGWQVQPHTDSTVQGQLNRALKAISNSHAVRSLGASRTDAGVHALSQTARVDIPLKLEGKNLVLALNAHLPPDIRLTSAHPCDDSFHPLSKVKEKEYRYFFSTEVPKPPHFRETISFVRGPLNIPAILDGMAIFEGKKNFFNYQCTGSPVKTTVRTIFRASLRQRVCDFPEKLVFHEISLIGDGFLRKMARLIVGTLFQLGRNRLGPEDIEASFSHRRAQPLGPVAPPEGLFLWQVTYKS